MRSRQRVARYEVREMETLQSSKPERDTNRRLCDRVRNTSYLASLPKLQGKATLVTSKLCEEIYKSTTGHVFDLSTHSRDPRSLAQLQYNSLHDPHLKSYLYRPDIQATLLECGHVSVNLHVACTLQEHNDYQYFLEREFLKLHNWEEEEKNRSRIEQRRHHPDESSKLVDTFKQERAENRKQYLEQQERKMQVVRNRIRKLKQEEEKVTQRVKEQQRLTKEKEEMKRAVIKEQKKFIKQRKEQEEAARRRLYYRKVEIKDCERVVNLHNKKQEKYAKRCQQLEERRMRYEINAQLAQEEEERKRKEQLEEKERKSRRREKIFKELQQRDIERKIKLFQENQQQALQLKQEADKFEAHWLKARESEVMKCRQKLQKWQQGLSIKVSSNTSKRKGQTTMPFAVSTAGSYQLKSLNESKVVQFNIQEQ